MQNSCCAAFETPSAAPHCLLSASDTLACGMYQSGMGICSGRLLPNGARGVHPSHREPHASLASRPFSPWCSPLPWTQYRWCQMATRKSGVGCLSGWGSGQVRQYPKSQHTLPLQKRAHPGHNQTQRHQVMSLCAGQWGNSVLAQVTRLRKDLPKPDAADFRKSIKSQWRGLNHSDEDIYDSLLVWGGQSVSETEERRTAVMREGARRGYATGPKGGAILRRQQRSEARKGIRLTR